MHGVVDRVSELSQRFRLYKIKDLHPTLSGQAKNSRSSLPELDDVVHGLRKKKNWLCVGEIQHR